MMQFPSLRLAGLAVILACASTPAAHASDPLTRFLDGLLKKDSAAPQPVEAAPAPAQEAAVPTPPAAPKAAPPARPRVAKPAPAPEPPQDRNAVARPAASPAKPKPVAATPPEVVRAAQVIPVTQTVPASTEAALDRINDYFNRIDQLTASFVQNSTNGQRMDGSLVLKRPGQLRFAYSPPSTLEIVSDGRSVAIRDKKLGTNDVYSIGQTPLKFLLKDQFNLARDVKVQDVQVSPAGLITVRFEDSATLGGTSKVTLRFDARANELKQWTVVDPQGYETTVVLSNLNVVSRGGATN
jgi:outer membrane lipoprotein-sorting protein